jgi:hypothetical protein
MSLKNKLEGWTDVDFAAYELAKLLGWIDSDATFLETKHLWWSKEGDSIYFVLNSMMENGILEKRDEPDIQYRWKKGCEP